MAKPGGKLRKPLSVFNARSFLDTDFSDFIDSSKLWRSRRILKSWRFYKVTMWIILLTLRLTFSLVTFPPFTTSQIMSDQGKVLIFGALTGAQGISVRMFVRFKLI